MAGTIRMWRRPRQSGVRCWLKDIPTRPSSWRIGPLRFSTSTAIQTHSALRSCMNQGDALDRAGPVRGRGEGLRQRAQDPSQDRGSNEPGACVRPPRSWRNGAFRSRSGGHCGSFLRGCPAHSPAAPLGSLVGRGYRVRTGAGSLDRWGRSDESPFVSRNGTGRVSRRSNDRPPLARSRPGWRLIARSLHDHARYVELRFLRELFASRSMTKAMT